MPAAHRILIILLFLSLLANPAWLVKGQDYHWYLVFGSDSLYEIGSATYVTVNENIYVAGSIYMGIPYMYEVFIARIDMNASDNQSNILWSIWGPGTEYINDYVYWMDLVGENLYVVGITGSPNTDIFVGAFNASDGSSIWFKTIGDRGDDYVCSAIADSSGNIYIVGKTSSYGTSPGRGYDALIVKLNQSGEVEWALTLGNATTDEEATAVTMVDGYLYVAGYSRNYSFIAIVNASTGSIVRLIGLPETMLIRSITVNSSNIYVAGSIGDDAFIARLNLNGSIIWAEAFGQSGIEDDARFIIMGSNGNLYVAGYTESYGQGGDAYVAEIVSENGSITWLRTIGGPRYDDVNYVYVNSSGYMYIAGTASSYGNNTYVMLFSPTLNTSLNWLDNAYDYNVQVSEYTVTPQKLYIQAKSIKLAETTPKIKSSIGSSTWSSINVATTHLAVSYVLPAPIPEPVMTTVLQVATIILVLVLVTSYQRRRSS